MPGVGAIRPFMQTPTRTADAAPSEPPLTFHELLADLNPLQHLPLIGPLYRAVTGDNIPQSARVIGSFVMGGLMGGPMGIVTNVALFAVEQATGINPEQIAQRVFAELGIGHAPAEPPAPAIAQIATGDAPKPFSPTQLAAYGIPSRAHA